MTNKNIGINTKPC